MKTKNTNYLRPRWVAVGAVFAGLLGLPISPAHGEDSKILQRYRAEAKVARSNLPTQLRFGEALIDARRLDEARRQFSIVRRLPEGEVPGAFGLAKIEIAGERVRNARGSCRKIIAAHPRRPEGHVCLGHTFLAWKRAARAEEPFEAALKIDPNNAPALVGLGEVHRLRLDERKAENAYRQALKLDPNNVQAHLGLGRLYAALGRNDDAKGALRQAISIQPDLAEPHYHLGILLAPSAEAAVALSKAAEIRPGWSQALEAWGQCLGALGNHERAVAVLNRAVAAQPNLAPAYHQLGLSHQALGQWDLAARALQRAVELVPSLTPAIIDLAEVRAQQGQHQEALTLYRQARSQTPNDPKILLGAGRLLRQMSRNTLARAQLHRAAELGPSLAAPEVELGDIYYSMDAFETARLHYEAAAARPDKEGVDVAHLEQRLRQLQK